jgi:acyl-CoA synthetase (NDP forming)/RimJ/RimL family protein N-acetyltransferase
VEPSGPERPDYPEHWEADVVLRDGGTAHVRPIRPGDADRLIRFYAKLSDETKYYRFFMPYPELSQRDVERFTHVDHDSRAALVALIGDEMIGLVHYEGMDEPGQAARDQLAIAEVAFLVGDAHQGRGLASVLLEHLAAAATERGIARFAADVLPANHKMINVFRDAGYRQTTGFEDGVVHLVIDLAPTETSLQVMRAREHRAEARSMARLLRPRSVAVVGVEQAHASVAQPIAQNLVQNIVAAGFAGAVFAVNHPALPAGETLATVVDAVAEVPVPLDLAIIVVPANEVLAVVNDCAAKGVLGLLVVSSGFAETGQAGRARQRALVRLARENGMRVVGPNSFGLINTDPDISLNASLSPVMPSRGEIGFFSQSGPLGAAILESAVRRGLGLTTIVSAGNRADVSGNDLLQYWEDDPATAIVLLYLESIGNPRKFSRLARRIARTKPIVAVKAGRFTQGVPVGHAVRETSAPPAALDAMFRQSGVIQVDTIAEMFDVAQVLSAQPLPLGRRVAVLGNSDALQLLAVDACARAGLALAGVSSLSADATAQDFAAALDGLLDDPDVDAVVAVFVRLSPTRDETVSGEVAWGARDSKKTVVATFLGPVVGTAGSTAAGPPSFPTPEEAVRALAAVVEYAGWRARPVGVVPELPRIRTTEARRQVVDAMIAAPEGAELDREQAGALLGHFGIDLLPAVPVTGAADALAAADQLGYPLVLKTLAPAFRHRSYLGGVRLNITTSDELLAALAGLIDQLGPAAAARLVAQPMAQPGVACVATTMEDPLFGPIVSFGVGGVATELLGDRAFRIPPLTDADAHEMVRSVRAAPLLFGYRGAVPADVAALEDILLRLSVLADDCPEVAALELNPVVVGAMGQGCAVVDADIRLAPPAARADFGPRRMSG